MHSCLFIFKNIKVVLDHIDAVEDGDDGHHEADAEPQQHRAVAPAVHIAVQHQVVHRGGCEGEHEDGVSYKPGDQQGAQGDKETKEQEQVGHQTNLEADYRLQITDYRLQITDYRLQSREYENSDNELTA